jgi:predicted AlkP superfamily phosphohydrolase/phosphomutase
VGEFVDRLSPEQSLLVVSDHGHGMRPPQAVYINEILRREQLLRTRESRLPGVSPVALMERAKSLFLRIMQALDLEDSVYRLASLIPKDKRRSLKTSSYAVVKSSSMAWVSDLGGGTSFSGIEINRAVCEDRDYEALRDRIIEILSSIRERDGSPIVKWVKRREDAFAGRNVHKYPDVVFELSSRYGVDRTLFCGDLGTSSTHKKISGGHSKYGVLMLYRSEIIPEEGEVHISSVFDLIHRILGLVR